MATAGPIDTVEIAKAEVGVADGLSTIKNEIDVSNRSLSDITDDDPDAPTAEELRTLRRVSGPIPWTAYTVAFVELCERFSYYGTTVVYVNFIQKPLPDGSNTGAGFDGQSGALGMGQRASTGLTTRDFDPITAAVVYEANCSKVNTFWAYVCPLLGAYLADAKWGRLRTIQYAIAAALVGHVILIIAAIPPVITHPQGSIACFSIGMLAMGLGVGGFKSNISPLLAEQQTETKMRVIQRPNGERVILDPSVTTSRMFLWFYVCINIGSLVGSISMVYAEKYVGFWLSYLLPTLMFLPCPLILWICKSRYILSPPTGSVLSTFFKLIGLSMKDKWSVNPAKTIKNLGAPDFWTRCKPSNIAPTQRPVWMNFDDAWVDEVRRGLKACAVFAWFPLYWLAYGQITNNLTSQAATMQLFGVPNDLIQNLNPVSILILVPLLDFVVYPALRRYHISFSPLKRIFWGFMLASIAMVAAAVIQYYIYSLGPCGNYMNSCDEPAPINVWVQALPYMLIGFSELFANVTSLEYAFTKAPKNMRSLIMSVNLFTNAISSAIAQALVSLSEDPLLVWNYTVAAVLAFAGGILFWVTHRKQDKEEDSLNMLPSSNFIGKKARPIGAEEKA